MSGNDNAADLTVYVGATGSGKTILAKQELRARHDTPRMVWSWKERIDHYAPEFGRQVTTPGRLAKLVYAGESVAYVPDRASDDLVVRQFDLFCSLALDVGGRVVLVEEMSIVANSRRAPAPWKLIVTEGRGIGLVPMASTQRPQMCDSTILDAATVIYCGRLNRGSSQKIMADNMGGLELARVRGLKPLEFLRWQAGIDGVALIEVARPRGAKRKVTLP